MKMEKIDTTNENKKITYQPENRDWSKKHIATATRVFQTEMSWFDGEERVVVEKLEETEKAVQYMFKLYSEYEDSMEEPIEKKVWLPKSQIEKTEDGTEIPVWLAKKKNIINVTLEKIVIVPEE